MKKTLIILLSLVLVVVMTAAGTMAYLTATTDEVKNTFTVGNLFDPDDTDLTPNDGKFVLYEHQIADKNNDGVYELTTTETNKNDYTVLPGVDIPKDPFVRTDVKLDVNAYVFVEIVKGEKFDSDALSFSVADTWAKLEGVTGKNGGEVYALKTIAPAGAKLDATAILAKDATTGKEISVDEDITAGADLGALDFYGYMIQAAGFEDAADAWAKGFGSSST